MPFANTWTRNIGLTALAVCGFSCAHTPEPDPHIHAVVPRLSLEIPVVIQGQVTNATTGAPVSHAVVYLVDLQPENWDDLRAHSARLGTANREGRIDLNATWSTKNEIDMDLAPVFQFDWVRDIDRLKSAAETRCRAGTPVNIAVVVQGEQCYGRSFLIDTNQITSVGGLLTLPLGDVILEPLPEGYWCYPDIKPAEFAPTSVAAVPAGDAP